MILLVIFLFVRLYIFGCEINQAKTTPPNMIKALKAKKFSVSIKDYIK